MNLKFKAHELANRMLDAGATVEDLLPVVTERMMKTVGNHVGLCLREKQRAWEFGMKSGYVEPRQGTDWTICVKQDLTVETIEVEYSILRLQTIELIDQHDRAPVPPFLISEVVELPSLKTTIYRQVGRSYGFSLLLARGR